MLEAKFQVGQRQKYKVTTNSNHQPMVLDNLLNRKFNISPSDQVYASDRSRRKLINPVSYNTVWSGTMLDYPCPLVRMVSSVAG